MTLAPAQLALIAGLEAPARSGPERVVPLEGGRPGLRVGARDGQVRDRTGHVVARVDLVRDDDGLTERETAFVDELVAAMVMGDLTSVRALWVRANPGAGASRDPSAGLEVLRRERVQAAVRSRLGPAVQAIGPLAVACLVQLLQHGKSEQVRLAVAQFVLAENGGQPGAAGRGRARDQRGPGRAPGSGANARPRGRGSVRARRARGPRGAGRRGGLIAMAQHQSMRSISVSVDRVIFRLCA